MARDLRASRRTVRQLEAMLLVIKSADSQLEPKPTTTDVKSAMQSVMRPSAADQPATETKMLLTNDAESMTSVSSDSNNIIALVRQKQEISRLRAENRWNQRMINKLETECRKLAPMKRQVDAIKAAVRKHYCKDTYVNLDKHHVIFACPPQQKRRKYHVIKFCE